MIRQAIERLIEGEDLDRAGARRVMEQIMSGGATAAQIGAFLIALRCKGESVEEVAGFAALMREKATRVPLRRREVIDTCGTGGDASGTFNISTAAAFVAAGAGLAVAKHGNRAISSRCGSADVLQALGVEVEISPEKAGACIDEVGIGFLFAPMLHGAMKHALAARREIGTRTVFNILGPLSNPAGARRQLIGVYAGELTEKMAAVLRALGSVRALVVHGAGGLDEIALSGPTRLTELEGGQLSTCEIRPEDFGLERAPPEALKGGDAEENARILRGVLSGEEGARRDVVLLNAAAAIAVGGGAASLSEGMEKARAAIDSGKALEKLEALKEASRS